MIFVSRPALAEDLNLNFATANQSLWGPGSATVLGDSFNIVDINQDLHLPKFDGDPISGLLDFLGLGDVASVSLSPSADVAAKLTASYQVNSGSIDVNYPQQVLLNLPGSIQAGQPFNVGLVYDTFENAGPIRFSSVNYADFLNSAAAGDGYSTTPVNKFMVPAPDVATEILPTPGFTTVSPFATASLTADLNVTAKINGEACILFDCFDTPDIKLGSLDFNSTILNLSSLTGLQLFGQPVIDLSTANFDVPGIGTVTFRSPSLNLDSNTLSTAVTNNPLHASGNDPFLSLGLDVDQLIPVVGEILSNGIGPFTYDLLSINPSLSLDLTQRLIFQPTLDVDLHFSGLVQCLTCANTNPTHDVSFALGQNETILPAGGGFGVSQMTITPTFTLNNSFINETEVSLDATLDVDALDLTGPGFDTGYAFQDPINLFSVPLFSFDPAPFSINIPSITAGKQTISEAGNTLALVSIVPDVLGGFDLTFGDPNNDHFLLTNVAGHVFATLPDGSSGIGGINPCNSFDLFVPCDQYFLSDQDIVVGNTDLGTLFCLSCLNVAGGDTNPFLTDLAGEPVYFSDLSTVPDILTANDVLDPNSPNYDPLLANSQFVAAVTSSPASYTAPVPEPGTLLLLGSGLTGLAGFRKKLKSRNSDSRTHLA